VDTIAKIECLECKNAVLMKARRPSDGEASIFVIAVSILLPCGHFGSDVNRWAGFVAEIGFEAVV
jgi:hypothetical protein